MSNSEYTCIVEKDKYGDLFIVIPEQLCKLKGWKTGTVIEWIDNKDGSWTLKEKKSEHILP